MVSSAQQGKCASSGDVGSDPSENAGPTPSENAGPDPSVGCEAAVGEPTKAPDSPRHSQEAVQPDRLPVPAAPQKDPSESGPEKPCRACDVGVVFALESESGGLEDLVRETGRWQGDGFLAIAGRWKDRRIVIVRGGAGQSVAAHATQALLDGHRPRWVISAGFAGALQPELKRNELLLPEAVINLAGDRLELSSPAHGPPPAQWGVIHRGVLLSADHLVSSVKEKRALGEKYGALAVEMETYGVVEVCQRRGVPVLAVRIIIDPLEEELPPEVRGLLKQKTPAARLGAALGALWNRPSSFKDLYRLRENALVASDRLAKFLVHLIPFL